MADNHTARKRSLRTAVVGIIPMVAHDEEVSFGNGIGAIGVQPAFPVFILNIGFIDFFIFNFHLSVLQFNRISRKAYNAFDKIGVTASGIPADDHIKPLGIPAGSDARRFLFRLLILPGHGQPG